MKSKSLFHFKSYVALVPLLIITLSVTVYAIFFRSQQLSNSTETWSHFAIYLSLFVGVSNLFVFIFISYQLSQAEDKRNSDRLKLEQPLLSFYLREGEGYIYTLQNIGRGAAINIRVIYNDASESAQRQNDPRWTEKIVYYSLGPGDELTVTPAAEKNVDKILAVYQDIIGRKYSFLLSNNESSFNDDVTDVDIPQAVKTLYVWQMRKKSIEAPKFSFPKR